MCVNERKTLRVKDNEREKKWEREGGLLLGGMIERERERVLK